MNIAILVLIIFIIATGGWSVRMSFEKFPYESPKIIVEFDLSVSAGTFVEGNGFPFSEDPLEIESLGLGDPFDLAH